MEHNWRMSRILSLYLLYYTLGNICSYFVAIITTVMSVSIATAYIVISKVKACSTFAVVQFLLNPCLVSHSFGGGREMAGHNSVDIIIMLLNKLRSHDFYCIGWH